jgi:hypothetical protein
MQIIPCKYVRITGLCLLLFMGFRLYGQEGGAQVYVAEGSEFALIAGGQRTVYRADNLGPGGFTLHAGDIIQTGPESFVEILLNPGGRVLTAAENTSFSYNITDGARVSLGLSYGRLRLRDGKGGSGGQDVFIRSGTAEAVFHGGDIGVDYIVQTARGQSPGEPVLRAYAFSGSVDVIPLVRGSPADHMAAAVPRFQVNAPEELTIEIAAPLSYVERKPLGGDIIAYWGRYRPAVFPFLSPEEPVPPSEAVSTAETPVPAGQTWTLPPGGNPYIRSNTAKNTLLIAGLSMSFIGAILEGIAQPDWNIGTTDSRNLNRYTGYGFFGLGALCFGVALFINPKLPVSNAAD